MSETKSKTTSKQTEKSTSKSTSTSQSSSSQLTKNVLDSALRDELLAGLLGVMTDEELARYADALLRPQLNAGIEASQQAYETTKLAKEQEIENLATMLARDIEKQNAAYRTSMADIETAALARGMGRSSYTLETLAKQGNALMEAVRQLTDESNRQQKQIQAQITQAAQQNAQTQNRLNTDYAANVLAKTEEIRRQQREEYNRNYLTATSAAMGQSVTGSQTGSQTGETTNSGTINNTSSTTTKVIGDGSGGGGGGGGGSSSSSSTTTSNYEFTGGTAPIKNPQGKGGSGTSGQNSQKYMLN
ncbi:MAG: hypothetical protein IJ418_19735 [Clostridia bacterium]|nr:hypothetical protein [Clostridia bacterium]